MKDRDFILTGGCENNILYFIFVPYNFHFSILFLAILFSLNNKYEGWGTVLRARLFIHLTIKLFSFFEAHS